jgi:NAD+ synthetase
MDSALVAVLAKPVCDELGVRLIGRGLSIETNKRDEVDRASAIGKAFCTEFYQLDLSASYNALKYLDALDESVVPNSDTKFHKIKFGNMKARTRMIYLYNLAYKTKGMVLSTDNYTEFNLGFSTIMGDWGDYGMIQQLWKTEVYDMGQWMVDNEFNSPDYKNALQSCIDAVATDGLGITNSDLDQLLPGWVGSSRDGYKEVDNILINYIYNNKGDKDNPVIIRYNKADFKRNWPIILKRSNIILDSEQ